MDDNVCVVKSYPEISLEAMRHRLEPQYRVWLLCRFLDFVGRGAVRIQHLRQFVTRKRLFSLRTLEYALAETSVFYQLGDGHVWLTGLFKVADALNVTLRDRPTWVPLADFASMFRLRQAFVASYFAHKPRTIAIDTLAMLTGRSRRTVSRYLESDHIVKTPNVMISQRDPHTDLTPEMAQEGYFHSREAGKTVLVKRMPNTYTTDLEPAAYGQVKQQQRAPFSTPTGEPRRRYFSNPKAQSRALQALSPHETVLFLSGNRFDDLGSQLWEGHCRPGAPPGIFVL